MTKISRSFFSPLQFSFFLLLLGVFAWNLSGVSEVLRLSCEAPAAHYPAYCSRAGPRALTDVYPAMHEEHGMSGMLPGSDFAILVITPPESTSGARNQDVEA